MKQYALALLATLSALPALAASKMSTFNREVRWRMARSDMATLDIQGALIVAGVIIAAVVGVQVIAALAGTWFEGIANLTGAFDTATTGDATADSLLPIFRLLIALAGVFALVGAALLAVRIRNR